MDFYRVKKLGRGVFSDVFLIKNNNDGLFYCQKVIKPKYLDYINTEKKILDILLKIKHPNIIKFFYEEKIYNTTSFIFEYMFVNLLNCYRIYNDKLNFYKICDYTWQITQALECIHSLFIIHCDLKPENIMVDHTFKKVKIIDFGSSIINYEQQKYNFYIVSRYYRAPELSLQIDYDEKDRYLGPGLYILRTDNF